MRFLFLGAASVFGAFAAAELLARHRPEGWLLLALALLLLLLGLLWPRIFRSCSPFRGPVRMAGLPSAHGSPLARESRYADDSLTFELEVLRLVNEFRRMHGAEEVGLHAALLAEARETSARIAHRWRLLPDCLRKRMAVRGHFSAGVEIASVLAMKIPEAVIHRWTRRRRSRGFLLSSGLDTGAVGLAVDELTGRRCVVLLMAELA